MWRNRVSALFLILIVWHANSVFGQQNSAPAQDVSSPNLAQLLEQIKAEDARLKELEAQVLRLKAAQAATAGDLPAVAAPAAGAPPSATPLCSA